MTFIPFLFHWKREPLRSDASPIHFLKSPSVLEHHHPCTVHFVEIIKPDDMAFVVSDPSEVTQEGE